MEDQIELVSCYRCGVEDDSEYMVKIGDTWYCEECAEEVKNE